jgi:hypothetical protein
MIVTKVNIYNTSYNFLNLTVYSDFAYFGQIYICLKNKIEQQKMTQGAFDNGKENSQTTVS